MLAFTRSERAVNLIVHRPKHTRGKRSCCTRSLYASTESVQIHGPTEEAIRMLTIRKRMSNHCLCSEKPTPSRGVFFECVFFRPNNVSVSNISNRTNRHFQEVQHRQPGGVSGILLVRADEELRFSLLLHHIFRFHPVSAVVASSGQGQCDRLLLVAPESAQSSPSPSASSRAAIDPASRWGSTRGRRTTRKRACCCRCCNVTAAVVDCGNSTIGDDFINPCNGAIDPESDRVTRLA